AVMALAAVAVGWVMVTHGLSPVCVAMYLKILLKIYLNARHGDDYFSHLALICFAGKAGSCTQACGCCRRANGVRASKGLALPPAAACTTCCPPAAGMAAVSAPCP